jgi:ABC-type multidrug transport system ATPase subunit
MVNHHLYGNDTKRMVGYVPQDEALFQTLTVAETIMFSAELRLPDPMSRAEKEEHVTEVGYWPNRLHDSMR